MKYNFVLLIVITFFSASFGQQNSPKELPSKWYLYETSMYDLYFTTPDSVEISKYLVYFDNAQETIEKYFGQKFLTKYDVYIHPNRTSLDLQFSSEWDMPGFTSQCWMVASGVADQFNLLSPRTWKTEACEHDAGSKEIQETITHELMHVYHGQINLNHFFENMNDMAWFIEGVSVLVSGQLDDKKTAKVQRIVNEDSYPRLLSKFWEGGDSYGISGSMVNFIREKYGVGKILELLKAQSNEQLLNFLKITEQELISSWANSIGN